MAVRRESVVLELESNLSSVALRDAAAMRLLNEEVNKLSGRGSKSGTQNAGKDIEQMGRQADKAGKSIDQFSGRLGLLGDAVISLGPGLIPIGAVGIPAVTGLASAFGFAALGAGTALGAFQGVGDALKALNKAHLEPTTANLDAAALAMDQISPAAQKFTRELSAMGPQLKALRDTAAAGMFPGLERGLKSLETVLPKVQRIMGAVSGELGTLGADAGASLAGPQWASFFTFLEKEAPHALADLAHAVGNVAHAAAQMWMAFTPLNNDFSSWMVKATGDLDKWATGLSKTQGFHEFIAYIQKSGPEVGDALAAIGDALLQIVEAAAPIGGPVLAAITAFANGVAKIADSDLGTPIMAAVIAMRLYSRAIQGVGKLSAMSFSGGIVGDIKKQGASLRSLTADYKALQVVQRANAGGYLGAPMTAATAMQIKQAERFKSTLRETASTAGKTAGAVGALALLTTGYADKTGFANTATLALAGSMAGPWGAAAGASAGLFLDLKAGATGFADGLARVDTALEQNNLKIAQNQLAKLKAKQADINKTSGVGDFFSDISQSGGASLAALLPGATVAFHAVDKATAKVKDFQKQAAEKTWVADSTGGLHKVADGFGATAVQARKAAAEIRANRKSANDVAHSFVGLGASLNDSEVSLNSWIHDMEESAQALSNFASNAAKAAKRGLRDGLIKELQAAGPEGALRMKQLADASDVQLHRANKSWVDGQKAIRSYTDTVGGVPSTKTTKIAENGALPAKVRIQAMRAEIDRLKSKSVKMDQHGAEIAAGKIAALRDQINQLHGKSISVVTHFTDTHGGSHTQHGPVGKGVGISARGNIFHYAQGDVANRHEPELAGPGPTRVWREPETQGEAYIPLANDDRRPRAQAIAAETVALLGGTASFGQGGFQHFATGGGVTYDSTGTLRHRFHALADAVERSTKVISKERSARDALVSKRSDLKSTVADKFQTDIFGDSNVWAPGGGAGNSVGILKADIAKAKAFQATLKTLKSKGLTGDALAALAATGDVGKAQAMASLPAADLKSESALYDQRTRAANQAGSTAGTAAYASQIAAQSHHLSELVSQNKRMEHEVKELRKELAHHPAKTGAAVGKAVNHAAGKSQRGR